jgi:hypothetical protein
MFPAVTSSLDIMFYSYFCCDLMYIRFTFTLLFAQQDSSGIKSKLNLKTKKNYLLYPHRGKLNSRTRNKTSLHAQSAPSKLAKKALKKRRDHAVEVN